MTILADLPAGYTLRDVVDIRNTIWTVNLADYSALAHNDRAALVKLLTWPGLDQSVIDLVALILDGQQSLPLDDNAATLLHDVLKVLPNPTIGELTGWSKAHPEQETSPTSRALATVAAHVVENEGEPAADVLRSALLAAVRAAWPLLPLKETPTVTARLIEQARNDMQAAESAAAVAA